MLQPESKYSFPDIFKASKTSIGFFFYQNVNVQAIIWKFHFNECLPQVTFIYTFTPKFTFWEDYTGFFRECSQKVFIQTLFDEKTMKQ